MPQIRRNVLNVQIIGLIPLLVHVLMALLMILSILIVHNAITCVKHAPEQLQTASNVQKIELISLFVGVPLVIQMISRTPYV